MPKKEKPTYYEKAKIICACGHIFTVGSTVKEMKVEVCSHCHPFFTGKAKLLDTTGRVERFKKILEKGEKVAKKRKGIKSKKEKRAKRAKKKKEKK